MNKGKIALSGELDAIKRSYPRNVVEIEIDGADTKALEGQLVGLTAGKCIGFKSNGAVLTATLPNPEMRGELLNVLQRAGVQISRFAVKEPTLEEIFIDKVGGSIEDLHAEIVDDDLAKNPKKRSLFGGRDSRLRGNDKARGNDKVRGNDKGVRK
jgi:hypothetical protein